MKTTSTTAKRRAVAYIRVSTEKQADEGVSLDAQRAKLVAYCAAMDLDLVGVDVDAGLSAKSLDRPALRAALARLDAGEADTLVVVKLDRLTRSVADLGRLVESYFAARCSLVSLSDSIDTHTAGGRLVLNVLASVSQWEREATAERTREAMAYKSSRGEYTGGGAPYGFAAGADGALVPVESEQAILALVREFAAAGLGFREIARELSAAGLSSRSGREFAATQIKRMVAA